MQPRPPFRIKLPRNLKGNAHALPGNDKAIASNGGDVTTADASSEKEKLIVESYIPPDPGPYPQDQPKQNSVRFTPTQVLVNLVDYKPLILYEGYHFLAMFNVIMHLEMKIRTIHAQHSFILFMMSILFPCK